MKKSKTTKPQPKVIVPGDILLERYKVLGDIHTQEVPYKTRIFRCYDSLTDRIVALKCINIDDAIHGIQQYKGAVISAELSRMSDHFVRIYDVTLTKIPCYLGKTIVISMEYIHGFTLASPFFWNSVKNFALPDKIRILYIIIEAISQLEDAGVVHTNLHPNHILISEDHKTVKICGFVNNSRFAYESLEKAHIAKAIETDEFHFRPVELVTFAHFITQPHPIVDSAMDVWSIGLIFAFMLKNGDSLFNDNTRMGYRWGSIFFNLGNPTEEELRDGLKSGQIWRIVHPRNGYDQLKAHIHQSDRIPIKWIKLLNEMLNYHPRRRITIKQLLNHQYFLEYLKDYPAMVVYNNDNTGIAKTIKIEPIQIDIPDDMNTWKHVDIKKYMELCLDMRKQYAQEKNRELTVVIANLVKVTKIPQQICIRIIVLANTRPIYIPPRK